MRRPTLAIVLLMAAGAARADDTAMAAANAFYAATAPLSKSGGIPDAAARLRLAPLLSQRLNQSLAAAAAAEARFKARNKDAPPLLEGDIFSSLFEGPTAWKVGACTGDTKAARCGIRLTHEDGAHQDPGQKPASWIDVLVLVNNGGWKVDDIAYDADFAFGNSGTLNQMLQMTVHEAQ